MAARHMQHARQAPASGGTTVATTAASTQAPPPPSPPAVPTTTHAAPPPPPPPGPPPGTQTTPVNPPGVPPPSPTVGGTGTTPGSVAPPPSPTTTYTFSLQSTNPTAVPLSDIVSTAPAAVTRPLDHTFAPGSQPTFLPGAPPLPNGQCNRMPTSLVLFCFMLTISFNSRPSGTRQLPAS